MALEPPQLPCRSHGLCGDPCLGGTETGGSLLPYVGLHTGAAVTLYALLGLADKVGVHTLALGRGS